MSPAARRATPTRRPVLGIVLVVTAFLFGLTGCGDDAESEGEATPFATVDPTAEATALAEQFDQVLRALNQRYEFTTTVESSGAVVSEISGRNIEGNAMSSTSVATNTIDLLSVDGAFWTRSGSGEWSPATAAPVSHDPLESLLAVTEVTVLEGVMTITIPGAVLGLEVDWAFADVTVTGPALELVAETEDGLIGRSSLRPATDLTAITAPA